MRRRARVRGQAGHRQRRGVGHGRGDRELLVELGAEVHAIDIKKPDLTGLASFTETDLREPAQIDSAVAKIGKVVNGLFNCAGLAQHVLATST